MLLPIKIGKCSDDEEYFFSTQTIYRSDSSFPSHIIGVIGSVLSSNVRLWDKNSDGIKLVLNLL
jgi:hypothetical protein